MTRWLATQHRSLPHIDRQPAPDLSAQAGVDPDPSASRITPTAGAGANRSARLVADTLEQNPVGAQLGRFGFQAFDDGIGLGLRGERE